MTLNIEGKLIIDTSELDAAEIQAETAVANQKKATIDVKKQADISFNEVMGMMRASYMMVSGIAQVMGGTLGQIFQSIYGVAVAAIGTYQAIAAAMAASGVGAFQAALMINSLLAAIVSLVGVSTGQEELSRRMSGLNMAIHGISGMISSFSL